MDVALERFNLEGIPNVSADDIIARAGVAKVTLYKYFPTKRDLAAAFVHERTDRWIAWLARRVRELARDPAKRVLALFDALEEWIESDDYYGCPFHRAAADFPESKNPIHAEVARNKALLRELVTTLVNDAKLNQNGLVNQLMVLIAGSEVMAEIENRSHYARDAKRAVPRLAKRRRQA
jgi:AcrR family transcriptional regulator